MRAERHYSRLGLFIFIILLVVFGLLLSCPPEQRPIFKEALKNYKVHYGLDLQGGSELLYQIDPNEIDATRSISDVIDETIGVISQRIFESNIVKDPRIQKEGENHIIVQLPGLNQVETNNIKKEIETLGNLEFRLVASKNMGEEIEEEVERTKYEQALGSGSTRLSYYQKRLLDKGYKWFPSRDEKEPAHLLWIKDGYDFTGKKFRNFYPTYHDARRAIGFELKEEYKTYFGDFTGKYKNERLAILFNNKVVAAPNISSRIEGVGVMVGFNPNELNDLMRVLRSGSLEIQPELVNENTIGPSLGQDAINLGIQAGLLGLLFVVIFMAGFYHGAGVVAVMGMILNVIIVGSILVIWGETLTLPGIAGFILTVGMSVDANILIFERIRDEKYKYITENGKPYKFTKPELYDIVNNGYKHAFTSVLTAIILYTFGSSAIQGFAFTLGWGIIASFFTAIVVTHLIFDLSIQIGLFRSFSMMRLIKDPKINFVKWMRPIMILTWSVIILSMGWFIYRGENNYGLELKGGILAQMSLEKPLQSEEVRERLTEDFQVEVQHIVGDRGSDEEGWYEFSVRLPNLNQEKIDAINQEIEQIANQLRTKNTALKDRTSTLVRTEENEKRERRTLRSLKAKGASAEEQQAIQDTLDRYLQIKNENKEIVTKLGKEIEELTDKRSDLMRQKNHLSGIEELRKTIEKKFKDELSPEPFGEITRGTGRFTTSHIVPVRFRTPMSSEFAQTTLEKHKELFSIVEIGSEKFRVTIKEKEDSQKTAEEMQELVKRQLDIASRLEASNIDIKTADNKTTLTLTFADIVPTSAVKRAMERCNWENFNVQALDGENTELKNFAFVVTLSTEKSGLELEAQAQLIQERVRTAFADATYNKEKVFFSDPFPRFTQISGLVAKEQKTKAYQAIILSLIVLLIYIAVRFPNGWIYGVGAIAALTHDVLISLGCIAVFGYLGWVSLEINLTTIAALLTLVGYSLNDTIVIYDRIRENKKNYDAEIWARMDIKHVEAEFNKALNQTLSRTLLTSVTTMIVLACIFFLNYGKGSVMEGFSFILMIGIIAGTYSSIFVATAIVLGLEKRNREQ